MWDVEMWSSYWTNKKRSLSVLRAEICLAQETGVFISLYCSFSVHVRECMCVRECKSYVCIFGAGAQTTESSYVGLELNWDPLEVL